MNIQSFITTPFIENCYVIEDDGEAAVIDPGELTDELANALSRLNLKLIINTHCHIDHSGGNAAVKRMFPDAPLLAPEKDLPLLQGLSQQGRMFGVQAEDSPPPDQFIAEGDAIKIGNQTLQVFDTPGHSPGHIILVGEGFVFGGDVLFQGSIGRTDLPGGSFEQLMHSIRDKMLCLPDNTTVYCGHGPATTIGAERTSNPFILQL